MASRKSKKSDTSILFPNVSYDFSIGKVTVKPFSYGDVIDLAPNLEEILNELKVRSLIIDLSNLRMDISDVLSIYMIISKPALPILERVTGLTSEEIRNITMGESAQLILTVIQQNLEVFMSFFVQSFGGSRKSPEEPKPEAGEGAEKTETTSEKSSQPSSETGTEKTT